MILIAEDNTLISNIYRHLLASAGYEFLVVKNGQEAVDLITSQEFDLLILDYQLPCRNGIELIEMARTRGPNSETPIFLCTAVQDLPEFDQSTAKLIHKPFSPQSLLSDIKQALS